MGSKWEDPEFLKAYHKERYRKHRKKLLEAQRRYREQYPEKIRKAQKKWLENGGREWKRDYDRKWYHSNIEKRREQAARSRRNKRHREVGNLLKSWR